MESLKLPTHILDWVEEATDHTVLGTRRVPGGASREAWFIDTRDSTGSDHPLFLRYSRERPSTTGPFLPLRTEAEVFLALRDTNVAVPRILAVHPEQDAILSERVPGETWFHRIHNPHEQIRVAKDFIRNLSALHQLNPQELDLPSFKPVKSPRAHALDEIALMRQRARAPDGSIDPLLTLCLHWLETNVPDYEGPTVLVQGDTGPGNFMYHNGRVTAVVDWELAHLGDPMDDIAWLSLRTVQHTFTDFPERLAEYQALSGHLIDAERIWYYRLFAEVRLATLSPSTQELSTLPRPAEAEQDVGNLFIYRILHQRLLLEALAKLIGLELPPPALPDADTTTTHTPLYDTCLNSLRSLVPQIEDALATRWAKGAARILKYLKEVDRHGAWLQESERQDVSQLLGYYPHSLAQGRQELDQALNTGSVSPQAYISYRWRRLLRNDFLMREASGALRSRTWPPIWHSRAPETNATPLQ